MVRIGVNVNEVLVGDIDKIVQSGWYGDSRAECLERLACEGMRALIRDGVLAKKRVTLVDEAK